MEDAFFVPSRIKWLSSSFSALGKKGAYPNLLQLFILSALSRLPSHASTAADLLRRGGTSPPPEGWPAPAPRDSELGLPLQID